MISKWVEIFANIFQQSLSTTSSLRIQKRLNYIYKNIHSLQSSVESARIYNDVLAKISDLYLPVIKKTAIERFAVIEEFERTIHHSVIITVYIGKLEWQFRMHRTAGKCTKLQNIQESKGKIIWKFEGIFLDTTTEYPNGKFRELFSLVY